MLLDIVVLLLDLLYPVLQELVLLGHRIEFGVELERLFPEDDHFLLQVLYAVIGGEHLLLLLRLVLDLCQFLLYLGDVVAIGVQKLRLVLFYHMLHLLVHFIDGPVQIPVSLHHALLRTLGYELRFALHQ